MTTSFGIDLGTTNSVISWIQSGKPVPIPIEGSPIVPSVVLFLPERVVVGREARNLELRHPELAVHSVKRKMGREHRYQLGGKETTPEEISAEILRALKLGAEKATGEAVHDVVITVPAYFDDAQRRATLKAGDLAGLNVLRLLNEPTSAALVYDQVGSSQAPSQAEIVMVYDLGGGTFDVSVLEVFEGVREVRATAGNTHLGGDDFDDKLVQLFLDDLKRQHGVDPREDACAMARLRRVAEETKIRLSTETQVHVREEFLTGQGDRPVHLDVEVTRRGFEALIEPLLESTLALCRRALEDAHLSAQKLGRICLVGGSTRIPRVRALLTGAFDADIHEEIDPDLAVALGASMQAGLLSSATIERILVDVAAHSLGVRVHGEDDDFLDEPDTFAPVLRRNTVLPAQRTEEFYTMVPDQERIKVEVFQGEAFKVSQNARVGGFDFPLTPVPAGSPVQVEFAYDLNGVVKVSVTQPGTDNAKTVALSVADAGRSAQQTGAGTSAVEARAQTLLARLEDDDKARLEELLERFQAATGEARMAAEEKLLDLFLDLEDA